jgi:predicted 3-demethylubiquinone-9 3-methyltransferase (glyoxalase superfamily)
VQRNVADTGAGKTGTVLTVAFTLAGQRFVALNGGTRHDFTLAISFQVECDDQAEIDRLWDTLSDGGSTERCGWLKDRYGVSWQIVPTVLPELLGDHDCREGSARDAGAAADGQARHRGPPDGPCRKARGNAMIDLFAR